jgi:hypothetical protein
MFAFGKIGNRACEFYRAVETAWGELVYCCRFGEQYFGRLA